MNEVDKFVSEVLGMQLEKLAAKKEVRIPVSGVMPAATGLAMGMGTALPAYYWGIPALQKRVGKVGEKLVQYASKAKKPTMRSLMAHGAGRQLQRFARMGNIKRLLLSLGLGAGAGALGYLGYRYFEQ